MGVWLPLTLLDACFEHKHTVYMSPILRDVSGFMSNCDMRCQQMLHPEFAHKYRSQWAIVLCTSCTMLSTLCNLCTTFIHNEQHADMDHTSQLCCSLYAWQEDWKHKHAFIFTADQICLPHIHHTETQHVNIYQKHTSDTPNCTHMFCTHLAGIVCFVADTLIPLD